MPGSGLTLPMGGQASCGFPSPADHQQPELSLDELVGLGPRSSLFLARAWGVSMRDKGIFHNDVLIVDKARTTAEEGAIVVAVVDSEFLVKQVERQPDGSLALVSGNSDYPPLIFSDEQTVMIWGVCIWNLHNLTGGV